MWARRGEELLERAKDPGKKIDSLHPGNESCLWLQTNGWCVVMKLSFHSIHFRYRMQICLRIINIVVDIIVWFIVPNWRQHRLLQIAIAARTAQSLFSLLNDVMEFSLKIRWEFALFPRCPGVSSLRVQYTLAGLGPVQHNNTPNDAGTARIGCFSFSLPLGLGILFENNRDDVVAATMAATTATKTFSWYF